MNFNLPPKNLRFFKWGLGAFLVFMALSALQVFGLFFYLDPQVTVFLQNLIPRSLDQVLSIFSLVGNLEPTTAMVGLIALWIYRKKKQLYFPLILFVFMMIFELIGKYFLYHPGPPKEFFRFNLPFEFPRLHVETNYSFPSGHVSRAAFLTVLTIFLGRRNRLIIVSCVLFLFLMALSRVYLGEHWTSDVFGGLFLGGSMALLALVYY